MSARNSLANKRRRREQRAETATLQESWGTHGICRLCSDRTLLTDPERLCVGCFLKVGLALRSVFAYPRPELCT